MTLYRIKRFNILFLIVISSLLGCIGSSQLSPSQDNINEFIDVLQKSTAHYDDLTIRIDESDPISRTVIISGLTNSVDGVAPPSWTLNIRQQLGIRSTPTNITIQTTDFVLAYDFTHTVMVAFDDSPAVSYTLKVRVDTPKVADWFSGQNVKKYVSGQFDGLPISVSFDYPNLIFRQTNSVDGSGSIEVEVPRGFKAEPSTISITDPDGERTTATTVIHTKLKISEENNPTNSETYNIVLDFFQYNSPLEKAHITAEFAGIIVSGKTQPSNIIISEGEVLISGFTNIKGAAGTGSVFIQDPTLKNYTIETATTPPSSSITFPLNNPEGTNALEISLDPIIITTPNGQTTTNIIKVLFVEELVELRITSANIVGSPVTISSGETLSLTENCAFLDPVTIEVLNANRVGSWSSSPITRAFNYNDGIFTDESGTPSIIITRILTISDNDDVLTDNFVVNIRYPLCVIDGEGTINNPYLIDKELKLISISFFINNNQSNYKTADYRITRDLDLTAGGILTEFPYISTRTENAFSGALDCSNHTLSNINIDKIDTDNLGFFGVVENATIKNCVLSNVNITGQNRVGALIGSLTGHTIISNTQITNATVSGRDHVGGFIGSVGGPAAIFASSVINLSNNHLVGTGLVSGGVYIGGLIGSIINHTAILSNSIRDSYVTLNVTGNSFVGGLLGASHNIRESTNFIIENSYATGNVSGGTSGGETPSGGLVGQNEGIIKTSYATGSVTGSDRLGGLVGENEGIIESSSYATGSITGTHVLGGLVGLNVGTIEDSHATGSVTGRNYLGGLVGEGEAGVDLSGSISRSYAKGHISGTNFLGGLVGRGGSVSLSYATGNVVGSNYLGGLVGWNTRHRTISKSYANGTVEGDLRVGGLVGFNEGTIDIAYATGDIQKTTTPPESPIFFVGGLVGRNFYGHISNSYAAGNVDGMYATGGLVGMTTFGEIINSYAIGTVTGNVINNIGGLIGSNDNRENLSTSVIHSYWDSITSTKDSSAAGTARTTPQLQVAAPVPSGANEVYVNWLDTIWNFQSGQYPSLRTVVCPNRQRNPTAACN
ncbi:hypothetical protein COTS27_00792 [Spirochaetota bacterium]|nr:hypothetical protein COTS27_00792 [Spirochaetota bacterium]